MSSIIYYFKTKLNNNNQYNFDYLPKEGNAFSILKFASMFPYGLQTKEEAILIFQFFEKLKMDENNNFILANIKTISIDSEITEPMIRGLIDEMEQKIIVSGKKSDSAKIYEKNL